MELLNFENENRLIQIGVVDLVRCLYIWTWHSDCKNAVRSFLGGQKLDKKEFELRRPLAGKYGHFQK